LARSYAKHLSHIKQEEDFATQVYNRDMLRRVPVEEVVALMKHIKHNFEDQAGSLNSHQELLDRLTFRINFLVLLLDASSGTIEFDSVAILHAQIDRIKKSKSHTEPLHKAFSIKIQHRLASSVPPRPMVACPTEEALKFMDRFIRDIPATLELMSVTAATDLHTALWTFMSQAPTPCVYIRSLAQSFLSLHNRMLGHYQLEEFVVADLRALVLPSSILLDSPVESPADPRFQIGAQVNQFVQKVSPSFLNQFRSFALNRSRVRRNLCHAAVEWDNIQADAEDVDGYLQTLADEKPLPYGPSEEPTFAYSLSSWVYHHKLAQLRLLIQMGFELDIYAPTEYVDMYWYLSHISGLHLSHLERISYFIAQAKPLPHWNLEKHRNESQKSLALLYRHFSWMKATDTLASALQRVFIVLARHGHLGLNGPTYSTGELRHELRMRPFQPLSVPEPIPYEELKLMSRLGSLSDSDVLDQAARLASASRKAWDQVLKDQWNSKPLLSGEGAPQDSFLRREWTANVKNNMKACIGVSIAITTLTKVLTGSESNKAIASLKINIPGPEDAERFHRWWAVPKIGK
jgi:N-alpha-acetyltransferase 35, NatC auxiliary subunit